MLLDVCMLLLYTHSYHVDISQDLPILTNSPKCILKL